MSGDNFGMQTAAGHLTVPAESKEPYAADVLEGLYRDAEQVVARYPQKRSALQQSELDLERTEIRAPIAGTIVNRTVQQGQTVAASLQAPELFIIARDQRDMQVETSIDEADVGRIRVGQRATFNVDAFPRRPFAGEVRSVRKAAQAPPPICNLPATRVKSLASSCKRTRWRSAGQSGSNCDGWSYCAKFCDMICEIYSFSACYEK